MDTSCKVAELPQRPLRRVAVSLSQSRDDPPTGFVRRGRSRRSLPQEDVEEKTKSPRPKKELRCVPERWPQSAANQRVKSSASSARGLPKPATRATDGQPTPATHRECARAAETAGEAHDAKQTMSTTGPPKKLTLIR